MRGRAPSRSGARARRAIAQGCPLLLLAVLGACGGGDPEPAQAAEPALRSSEAWAADDRLVPIVQDCFGRGRFEVDTSDMLPVLVAKLQKSQLDVLRNVREELALLGEPAVVELDRLVRRVYSEPHGSPTILNALGVLQLSEAGGGERAQELLAHCLGHPQETIRNAAIRALGKRARPEIYDDLLAILRVTHDTTKEIVVSALYQADRRRFERDALRWMAEQKNSFVLRHAAGLMAQGADAETARLCAEWIGRVEDRVVRGYLVATQNAAEPRPEEPFAILAEMIQDPDAQTRLDALSALEYTDATELIAPVLISDPEPNLRLLAVGLLGSRVEEKVARDALQDGCNDEHDPVREGSLAALLAAGDARAADSALALLAGPQREVGIATRALKGRWGANPGLAARALALLRERFEARAAESIEQREFLVQSLAQVPGPESTRYLLQLAAEATGTIERVSAHRWLLMQASNTGPGGIEHLRQVWRAEPDLERRFDVLWSAAQGHDEATREFLLEVLEAERSAPHERLYAAERLAREGPASLVAPRIKRANLRMRDAVFRPAMECLLWRWYG